MNINTYKPGYGVCVVFEGGSWSAAVGRLGQEGVETLLGCVRGGGGGGGSGISMGRESPVATVESRAVARSRLKAARREGEAAAVEQMRRICRYGI